MQLLKSIAGAAVLASGVDAAWNVTAANIGTAAFGIAMQDAKNGVLPMNANGVGAVLLVTNDGGFTWNPSPANNLNSLIMLLDGAAYGSNVMVSGPLGEMYSTNKGGSFAATTNGMMSQGLNVIEPNQGFAAAGQFGLNSTNGVGLSFNGGKALVDFSATPLQTTARYVAAPSAKVLYLTAGEWPSSNSNSVNKIRGGLRGAVQGNAYSLQLTERITLTHEPKSKQVSASLKRGPVAGAPAASPLPDTIYAGQIAMSKDGGLTWTLSYSDIGTANSGSYFNGIACQDENTCCATAEGAVGASILCTYDGGASWETTYSTNADGASLMDVTTGAAGEYVAVGGTVTDTVNGWFLRSTDNGKTWTLDPILPGVYGGSVDCLPGTVVNGRTACWSSVLTALQTASVARNF